MNSKPLEHCTIKLHIFPPPKPGRPFWRLGFFYRTYLLFARGSAGKAKGVDN